MPCGSSKCHEAIRARCLQGAHAVTAALGLGGRDEIDEILNLCKIL